MSQLKYVVIQLYCDADVIRKEEVFGLKHWNSGVCGHERNFRYHPLSYPGMTFKI